MLLLKNGTVLTMADEGIIEQGDVLIDGGKSWRFASICRKRTAKCWI